MFRNAYILARNFTAPTIASYRTVGAQCGCSIGTFIVINSEGWILTACHIVDFLFNANAQTQNYIAWANETAAIKSDISLSAKDRSKKLSQLIKPDKNSVQNFSHWWAIDGLGITDIQRLPEVDLAAGRLTNFTSELAPQYPKFKNVVNEEERGVSLCKLGFPFHEIIPIWHEDKNIFELPVGTIPAPLFPLEGIYTRAIDVPNPNNYNFPLRLIETSSPGLRGQSGGPIFDVDGNVWGIQAQTNHLNLGFTIPGEKGSQYLHVGVGAHVSTITGWLTSLGIKFELSL